MSKEQMTDKEFGCLLLLGIIALLTVLIIYQVTEENSTFNHWRAERATKIAEIEKRLEQQKAQQKAKESDEKAKESDEKLGKEFHQLPTDQFGYIQVKNGQQIGFPVYNQAVDSRLFCLRDVFEVVGVVGSPKNHDTGLTDFSQNRATLVLKNHSAKSPQFFLFQWLGQEPNPGIAKLKQMFEAGDFLDEAGQAKTKSTGFFLYVTGHCYVWEYRTYRQFLGETRRVSPLVVGEIDDKEAGLYAKVFDPKEEGRLAVLVKDGNPLASLKTMIISKTDVSFVLDPNLHLPDPLADWLNEVSDQLGAIGWIKYDSKEIEEPESK